MVNKPIKKPINSQSFANNTLERDQAKTLKARPTQAEAIAVVGMSGRFPNAEDIETFWQALANGKNLMESIPEERWPEKHHFLTPTEIEKTRLGFLKEVDTFDPLFFNISPREAQLIDPQQRLCLQESWKALEHAGYAPGKLKGTSCGVFIGCGQSDYLLNGTGKISEDSSLNSSSLLAGRISYCLDLVGPCLSVDVACASSHVAIHLACESLKRKECSLAIAGGVSIMSSPRLYQQVLRLGILSPSGESRPFDASADGWLMGEAVAAIVLKPLSKAIEDKDIVYGVIKGSGYNHTGMSNDWMAPRASAQTQLQKQVYQQTAIDPSSIDYIETQGVSAVMGDQIEVSALKHSFGKNGRKQYCALGSLKPNMGHSLSASGVTALIKVLLALKYKQLPPTINVRQINEALTLEDSPFYVNTHLRQWTKREGQTRRSAINGFGLNGANVHLIIEEYRNDKVPFEKEGQKQLIILSAKKEIQLKELVINLNNHIKRQAKEVSLAGIAYTLQVGRDGMEHRLAFVVETLKDLLTSLESYLEDTSVIKNGFKGRADEHSNTVSNILFQDQDFEQTLKGWIRAEKLEKIAQAWVTGIPVDWPLLHKDKEVCRIALPTYPFERRRFWLNLEDDSRRISSSGNNEQCKNQYPHDDKITSSLDDYLCERVADFLGLKLEEVDRKKDLRQFGLNSVMAIKLKHILEKALSIDIPMEVLGMHPNLESLSQQLMSLPGVSDKVKVKKNDIHKNDHTHDPSLIDQTDHYKPFPLSAIQQAFFVGRMLNRQQDRVGCHVYYEFEVFDLDAERLKAAWNTLVDHHEMLRVVILPEAEQKVLKVLSSYDFEEYDLREAEDPSTLERHLQSVRQAMSHKVYKPGQWPLFEIKLTHYQGKQSFIHFSIDEWIVDASSVMLLLAQWYQLYRSPDYRLSALTYSFREYIDTQNKQRLDNSYDKDLSYWIEKLKDVPNSSILPKAPSSSLSATGKNHYERHRYSFALQPGEWTVLKDKAEKIKVSSSVLLLTLFTESLAAFSEQKCFALLLTFFNRMPVHPQMDELVGPFISTSIFIADETVTRSFEEKAVEYQKQLWSDIDHINVSGIEALRVLKSKGQLHSSFALPIVFTSTISNIKEQPSWMEYNTYGITQTPQVFLDHQLFDRDGTLSFNWDVVETVLAPGIIQELFEDYKRRLQSAASCNMTHQNTIVSMSKKENLALCEKEQEERYTPFL